MPNILKPIKKEHQEEGWAKMRFPLTGSIAVVGAMGLAACALGPDFVPPTRPDAATGYNPSDEAIPAQVALGKEVSAQWWRLFGSPDLNTVIALALENNRDLSAAKATLEQVQHNAQAATGALYPQLGLHGGALLRVGAKNQLVVITASEHTLERTGRSYFMLK